MNNKRVKYFIKDKTVKPVSKKEYLQIQKEKLNRESIAQAQLIKNRILTRTEIDKLVKAGVLLPEKHSAKIYFKKEDLPKAIKYLSRGSQD